MIVFSFFLKKSIIFFRIFLWFISRLSRESFFLTKNLYFLSFVKVSDCQMQHFFFLQASICPDESIKLLTFKSYQTCSITKWNIHIVLENLLLSSWQLQLTLFVHSFFTDRVDRRKERGCIPSTLISQFSWNLDQWEPLIKEGNRWYHHPGYKTCVCNLHIRNRFQINICNQVDVFISQFHFSNDIHCVSFNLITCQYVDRRCWFLRYSKLRVVF